MNLFLIIVGKLMMLFSKSLNIGSGSTWPGHIAMEANSKFLKEVLNKNSGLKVVLVAGTNGKTTTSKLLKQMLEQSGLRVLQNEAGANLLNGIASSVIQNSDNFGKLDYDVAIFEVDEKNLKLALAEIKPDMILILNIFRDQLDRYGEVNKVAKEWQDALKKLERQTVLITNGDDPELTFISKKSGLRTFFFGIGKEQMEEKPVGHDVDFSYCPSCGSKLVYKSVSYSHMGSFSCTKCSFKNGPVEITTKLNYPLLGKYNIYNTNAAALAAIKFFGVSLSVINNALKKFKPAFGRQEIINYKDKKILMLLSKNPAGFNQSIEVIASLKNVKNVALLLNDKIPDGRDVSWIWDVDFEKLPKNMKLFIGGERSWDMVLRIKYADRKWQYNSIKSLGQLIEEAVKQTDIDETFVILPTYSAMLEARRILTGKSIL